MEWISVEDRLPDNGQHVLIYINENATSISGGEGRARVFAVHFEKVIPKGNHKLPYVWQEFGAGMWFGHDVSHWMSNPPNPPSARAKA